MRAARTSQDLGAAIRAARLDRGWTQAELASRAGTSRQWVIAVERGHGRAEADMVLRALATLELRLSVVEAGRAAADRPRTWMTAADAAEAIREELDRDDTDFAMRMLARSIADFRALQDADDVTMFLIEPPSTGDPRWDTLLAAAIGRECRLRGVGLPGWTKVPPLRSWWFPDADPILMARTMQRTPVDLRVKGIWLDERALETV